MVTGAAHLARLEVTLLGLVQFFLGDPVLEQAIQFLLCRLLDAAHVLRIADGADGQGGALVPRGRGQAGSHPVRQALLLPDAIPQPRGKGAAAKNVVAQDQRRIIRIIITEREHQARHIRRVGLVGRVNHSGRGQGRIRLVG